MNSATTITNSRNFPGAGLLAGLRVVGNTILPGPELTSYPPRGPYYQRRLKKWKLNPSHLSAEYWYVVGGLTMGICYRLVKQRMAAD